MSFETLGLSKPLLKAIKDQGYTEPSPIQAKAIPIILEKKDVLAAAQTGTGKTAGFTLPMLELLSQNNKKVGKLQVKALVLTPTRELAAQVHENVKIYSKYTEFTSAVVFGGVGINPQKAAIKKGVDILVATPGRMLDLVEQKALDLRAVEFFVLDEADRMLDMGFVNDIKKVLKILPKQKQNLLFSATFSKNIKELAAQLLNNPILVEVAKPNQTNHKVKHIVHKVNKNDKNSMLSHIISEQNMKQVLVFTRTKHGANKLCKKLEFDGISSAAIHGNKSQGARTKALADFKAGSIQTLVATDIAARGIDIADLPYVINYELPNVPEDYVHRIGRTGRAGKEGQAISLVCIDEDEYLRDIEKLLKTQIEQVCVDGFEVDPTIKAEPKKKPQGRGGQRGGNRTGGNKPKRDDKSSNNRRNNNSNRGGNNSSRSNSSRPSSRNRSSRTS
jgi:ATP-dependent RNA helicase RhlE